MIFSRRTLAALARFMGTTQTHSDLNSLFYEYELETTDSTGNKQDRSLNFVRGLEQKFQADEGDPIIRKVTEMILNKTSTFSSIIDNHEYQALISTMRLDGFEFAEGRLRPTTPAPAALGPEISVLENDLNQQGMTTASAHYTQAVENFTLGNWEACNGQIRSFVEDFFIGINKSLTGTTRTNAIASLQDLQSNNYLDQDEFHQFKSFWSGIQDRGPHRGLSDEQEALFRLHVSTSIARYLIFKRSLQR